MTFVLERHFSQLAPSAREIHRNRTKSIVSEPRIRKVSTCRYRELAKREVHSARVSLFIIYSLLRLSPSIGSAWLGHRWSLKSRNTLSSFAQSFRAGYPRTITT